MSGGSAQEAIDQLHAAADALAAIDPTELDAHQRGALIEELTSAERRLDFERHRCVASFDASGDARELGYVTTNQWMRDRLRCPGGEAAGITKLARQLRQLPMLSKHWAGGAVGASHARLICSARNERTADHFDDAEAWFAEQALALDDRGLRRVVKEWKLRANPDDDPAADAERDRDAHVSETFGGTVVADALLDPIRGAVYKAVFDRIVDELFEHDWAEARDRLGRTPTVDELERTHAQRRADALVEMAKRAERVDIAEEVAMPRPLITVLTGPDSLAGGLATLWGSDTPLTAQRLADLLRDDPDIERFVYDSESVPIRYNPKRRTFTGRLRRAIQVRDRRCTGRGCDAPGNRCQVDHIVPVDDHGETTPDNGRLACGPCNRARPRRRFDGDPDP